MEKRIDAAIDIARAEREALRWIILSALWHGRPYGAEETLLLSAARTAAMRRWPAEIVQQGTTPNQRTITGTLATLPERATQAGLKPPTLIIVGEVVRLRDKLAWFEKTPL